MKIIRIALYCLMLVLVGIAGFVIGALTLGDYSPNMLLELVSSETPRAKITAYLQAVQAQDWDGAMAAWTLPASSSRSFAELSERRNQVTDELLPVRLHISLFLSRNGGALAVNRASSAMLVTLASLACGPGARCTWSTLGIHLRCLC